MDINIDKQKEEFFRGELGRLNGYFSDFTTRIGVLVTSGGLLSFLPSLLGTTKEGYLEYFLIWTFPFLLIALICYYPSSLRVQSVVKGIPFASDGSDVASEILNNKTEYLELVWRKTVSCYDNTLLWYKISNALMYAYFLSLSLSFYIFTFSGEPSIYVSISILFASIMVIGMMLFWSKLKSAKGLMIGGIKSDIAVGGIPNKKYPLIVRVTRLLKQQ